MSAILLRCDSITRTLYSTSLLLLFLAARCREVDYNSEEVTLIHDGGLNVGQNMSFMCPPGSEFRSHISGILKIDIICNTDGVWVDISTGKITQKISGCKPRGKIITNNTDIFVNM